MEEFILDFVNFVGNLDFSLIVRVFFALFAVFWVFIVVWVWFDATDRSNKIVFRVFSVLLVLCLNILGLIVYFLIRPEQSYEERYWQELEKKYLEFETYGLINCADCNFSLEPNFIYCPSCGKDLRAQCSKCGEFIEKYWKFCAYCGFVRDSDEIELEVNQRYEDIKEGEKSQPMREVFKRVCSIGENSTSCIQKAKRFLQEGDNVIEKEKMSDEKSEKKKVSSKQRGRKSASTSRKKSTKKQGK